LEKKKVMDKKKNLDRRVEGGIREKREIEEENNGREIGHGFGISQQMLKKKSKKNL
jgi:hypothetical protein